MALDEELVDWGGVGIPVVAAAGVLGVRGSDRRRARWKGRQVSL